MKVFQILLMLTIATMPLIRSAFAPLNTFDCCSTISTTRNCVIGPVAALAASEEEMNLIIDDERRFIMNLLMVGTGGVVVAGFGIPFLLFFVPPDAIGGSGPTVARDVLGKEIMIKEYLATKPANDRSLAQGLKGDPTYLIVKEDKTLENYGLNAICTHLGCVVPWSAANNKFICPCHASQYSADGTVIRGPAPLPLALAHRDALNGKIVFSPWTEDDFRTGRKGWWK